MAEIAWLVPVLPFVGFWLILFLGKKVGPAATSLLAIGAVAAAFVISLGIGADWIQRAESAEDGNTEPVEITTNGDSYECEGVVVRHEEHGAAEGEGAEAAPAEGSEGDAAAAEPEGTGLPECDTIELQAGAVAGAESNGSDGETGSAEAEGHSASAEGEHEGGAAGPVITRWTWFTLGDVEFTIGTHVDGLAAMMLFVVTTVSLLVHIYSTEYLKGDRRHTHYFAFLNLFTASMLFYVLAENLLQMLVGWELVGLCSFALIGHWWEEKPNSDAALKAFFTDRVGDSGMIIGIIVLFFAVGGESFSVLGINEMAATGEIRHGLLLAGSLLLFAGVTSKSGQFPLHTWLPDAMAGPTPVSALIHAATMVVAGVYLVARLYPVFYEGLSMSTGTLNYVALIGGLTTLVGGLLAFVQRDIKKVLAYSTISQLGYMVMALGVGAWTAGVFHIFTHAFFKAALFLGAGSVSHACHHSFDMKADMGGLRKHMPHTFATFAISSAALAGIAPLAGFWSKDEILAGAAAGQGGGAYTAMLVMGLITALLTAAYMTRCIYLTFLGEHRGHGHPHESPAVITAPLWILTTVAVFGGAVNLPGAFVPESVAERFKVWVEPTVAFAPVVHAEFEYWLAGLSLLLAFTGIALAYGYYAKGMFVGLTERSRVLAWGYRVLENKYYLDWLYTDVIVGAVKGPIARAANWFNKKVLDGIVDGTGSGSVAVGRWVYRNVDQLVVDGAVDGSGALADEAGQEFRKLWLSGRVQQYGAWLFGATVVLAAALIVFV